MTEVACFADQFLLFCIAQRYAPLFSFMYSATLTLPHRHLRTRYIYNCSSLRFTAHATGEGLLDIGRPRLCLAVDFCLSSTFRKFICTESPLQ